MFDDYLQYPEVRVYLCKYCSNAETAPATHGTFWQFGIIPARCHVNTRGALQAHVAPFDTVLVGCVSLARFAKDVGPCESTS